MEPDISQETVDAIIDALSESDKARAILIYYRASGSDLTEAWQVVQKLLVDLGEDADELADQPGADPAYNAVNDYLNADGATRLEKLIRPTIVALILLGVATYIIVPNAVGLTISLRSLFWPSTEAKVLEARSYSERRYSQQRWVSTAYMDFTFQYEVDGQDYTDGRRRVQYYELFGDRPFKAGDTFPIIYYPDNPALTVYDRQIYHRLVRLGFGLVCLTGGALTAAMVVSIEIGRRRLKQFDNR